jgi:D-alanine-D-alanine ligase
MNWLVETSYEKIKNLKICIVTGTGEVSRPTKLDLLSEEDTFHTARKLLQLMLNEGFKHVDLFTATENNLPALKYLEPDVFLNLAEGQRSEFSDKVFRTLFPLGIPVTGSSDISNEKATNKETTKMILEENQIPTPPGIMVGNTNDLPKIAEKLNFPLIIKPVFEDGSTGIFQKSVVENEKELESVTLDYLKKYNQPVLIEKYISSREFSPTGIFVNGKFELLPIAEIIYNPVKNRKWNIYCYKTKWLYDSEEYKQTPSVAPPENLSNSDYEIIRTNCEKVAKIFEINDYIRFDIRFDEKTHTPYFLDINTNPSLEVDPKYSLAISVKAAGLNMAEFTALIIKSAMERYGKTI